jgi:hypothetical protein
MMRKLKERPEGHFDGVNIMTPNIIAYYRLQDGYAELSEGLGMDRTPLYGVTISPLRERSRCFASLAEAMKYIGSLS